MATLNRDETEAMRKVITALDMFAQPKLPMTDEQRIEIAKLCKDRLRTIVMMKGYYPK